MSSMNQGDVFLCVNKLLARNYVDIADTLSEIAGYTIDYSVVNRIANQRKKGIEILRDKAEAVCEVFFGGAIRSEPDELLESFMDWADGKPFRLSSSDNISSVEYMRRTIKRAVRNWNTCRNPEHRKSTSASCPALRNQNLSDARKFIGRESLIENIKKILTLEHAVVLSGMAGIGKSFLARQFAIRSKGYYSNIQEVITDNLDPSCLMRNLILKTSLTGLKTNHPSEQEAFEAKLSALVNIKARSLLILDSVDASPKDITVLDDILRNSSLHIIITTRMPIFLENLYTLSIPPLERDEHPELDEQVELFTHYLERSLKDSEEMKTLNRILGYCDGNTMYIEHIARYIRTWGYSLDDALQLLKGKPLSGSWSAIKDSIVYEDANFTGVFRKILFPRDVSTASARTTLKALALLPPEGVSRKLFLDASDNDMRFELVNLEREGYVIRWDSQDMIRLHPVVCSVIRDTFFGTDVDCGKFLDGLFRVMNNVPYDNRLRDLYGITINVLEYLRPSEFGAREYDEWIRVCRKFFGNFRSGLNDYEHKEICARLDSLINGQNTDNLPELEV